MKVYIVLRCFGDHTRIEKVFACKQHAEMAREAYDIEQMGVEIESFHVITKKVDDLSGLDIKALLSK